MRFVDRSRSRRGQVLRVIAGIGLGAELVLVDTYLAEFLPAKARGRMTAWAYTIGFTAVPLAALFGEKLVAVSPKCSGSPSATTGSAP